MNFKQFRQPANGHSRTALAGGRIVGGRGFRLMSKIGQGASGYIVWSNCSPRPSHGGVSVDVTRRQRRRKDGEA